MKIYMSIVLLLACCTFSIAAPPLTEKSLYHLTDTWTNQNGQAATLGDFSGKWVVIAMFFSHCDYVCPRLVTDMRHIDQQLDDSTRTNVCFVLASFDTPRDQPARLKEFASEMQLPLDRWTLLHGDENAVRNLAAVLSIKYKQDLNGNFGHSIIITLLDNHGEIAQQAEGLGTDSSAILKRIQAP